MSFGKRLKIALTHSRYKQKELAEVVGLTPQQISNIVKSDERGTKMETATKMAITLGVRVEWLINGEEPMQSGAIVYDTLDDLPRDSDIVTVSFPQGFSMASGVGVENSEFQPMRSLPFHTSAFDKAEVSNSEHVVIGMNKGHSNEPFISDSEAIGLDLGFTNLVHGEMYLFTVDGEERLKMALMPDDTDSITLHSLNPDKETYPDEEFTYREMVERQIVARGRLWWTSSLLPTGAMLDLVQRNKKS